MLRPGYPRRAPGIHAQPLIPPDVPQMMPMPARSVLPYVRNGSALLAP
jgi:hypothetical protein